MNSDASMAASEQPASASIRGWPLVILVLFLPVWSIGVFYRGIWMPDEPREYDIAINMVGDHDLVVPHLAGEPFLEKPPFAYWLQSASLHLFGESAGVARVPNLLYAVLAALCIGILSGDLAPSDKRSQAAILGAVCFGTTFLLLQVQIWLATDAPLLAMTAVALLSTWRLVHAQTWQQQVPWAVALGTSLSASCAGPTLTTSRRGLVTYYILFVLDLATRTVKVAGITSRPDEAWMMQMARNLTDAEEPFLRNTRFLIMDRDTKYSAVFRAALTPEHIESIQVRWPLFLSRRSPLGPRAMPRPAPKCSRNARRAMPVRRRESCGSCRMKMSPTC